MTTMCYLYPQVYNDGCEVKVTPKKTSCVPCAEHARVYQVTRQPCHKGRVVISSFGLCPEHEQPHDDDETGGQQQHRRRSAIVGQRHPRNPQQPQDGGPSSSWFEIDVSDDDNDDKESVSASSNRSRGSSASLTEKLWSGWMAKFWGSSAGVAPPSPSSSSTTPAGSSRRP